MLKRINVLFVTYLRSTREMASCRIVSMSILGSFGSLGLYCISSSITYKWELMKIPLVSRLRCYLHTFSCQSLDFVLEDTFCQGAYILLLLEPANTLVEKITTWERISPHGHSSCYICLSFHSEVCLPQVFPNQTLSVGKQNLLSHNPLWTICLKYFRHLISCPFQSHVDVTHLKHHPHLADASSSV